MKRIDQNIAGRPRARGASGFPHRDGGVDEAGMLTAPGWSAVTSFRHALRRPGIGVSVGRVLVEPAAAFAEDAMLLEDFAGFLSDEEEVSAEADLQEAPVRLCPDAEFRERLRGRLWRTFVQTHLRDGGGWH